MDKRDYVWVAIRIFGIYLLVQALLAFPELVSSLVQVSTHWTSTSASDGEMQKRVGESQRIMLSFSVQSSIRSLSHVVICGAAGLYLVRRGRWLFNWIFPRQSSDEEKTKSNH